MVEAVVTYLDNNCICYDYIKEGLINGLDAVF